MPRQVGGLGFSVGQTEMYAWLTIRAVRPRESYFATLSLHSLGDNMGLVTSASQGEQSSLSLRHPRLWVWRQGPS